MTTDHDDADELAELEELLDQAADQCIYKIAGDGRITDPAREKARSKWVNSLVRVVKERRQVYETRKLEDLEAELEELKERDIYDF